MPAKALNLKMATCRFSRPDWTRPTEKYQSAVRKPNNGDFWNSIVNLK
jgi:hypothetical protein